MSRPRRHRAGGVGAATCALASLLLLEACGPEVVYEQDRALPGYWAYADSVGFDYDIADTARRYDLRLVLGHTDAFPNQNLYARFVTRYPGGGREVQDVSLELADRRGNWLGSCAGEACDLSLVLQEGARFPSPGTYGLTLIQYGRSDSLGGLRGIGLTVSVASTD